MTPNPIWSAPIDLRLIPTNVSESFRDMTAGTTGIPLAPHPGAYGVERKNHTHEGVDLYCDEGTIVRAVEDGIVVAVLKFTGPSAEPPSPWWRDTDAVMVEGASGVVLYGEIKSTRAVGDLVRAGDDIGAVVPVLTKDKGRPMTMLHLELHQPGTRDAFEWPVGASPPASLIDPTPYLLDLAW